MDIQLHSEEYGSGEALILLHGNGESGAYFEKQIAPFSERFHVITVDTRGHGQSPRGRAPFSLIQFAEDLYAFFQQHGITKAHVLGFSDGGNIALIFALRHPECVDKLILNGANLNPAGVKISVQAPILLGYFTAKLFQSEKAKQKVEMLGLMVHEPHIDPTELAGVTAETLVIAGTKDMIRTSHTKLIAASLPHAKLVLLDGDHFIAAKRAEAFNAEVLRFLTA